ncbi:MULTISPECIES: TRAP transporter small permease [Massilia]|uniref:TRAP transporter small permease protein n=2 Tax=Massilia TaxID=149698 RepID=A0ABY4A2S0_9BURK|nr:TRAP transporter small permease [Massilia violaceinigra]NHZ43969.1 TRAP transporter small permease [Massilia aquatica]UOD29058.1 TRAP transporter small permease [Massilia violaceinigra]
MSHGFELAPAKGPAVPDNPTLAKVSRLLDRLNSLLLLLSMWALVITALVLTYSVVSRYFFKLPTDWQDEAAVFMLVGVTFFCTGYVQSMRGHIGIEALASLLPPKVNAVRLFLVDLISCLFCAFFSWKSWTLFHEAWVDGQTTSSTFAPPLWIPYGMMALGISILTLQILIQVLAHVTNKPANKPADQRSAP